MPELDPEKVRADIQQCARAASFAVDMFVINNAAQLARCTKADQTGLTVRATLAYLIGHGLVTVTPDWPEWLQMDIPEPLAADLAASVAESVASLQRMNAATRDA